MQSKEYEVLNASRFRVDALTSAANVDVQIAFDDGAVLQGLSGVHRVDDGRRADLVTQAIARSA